MLVKFQINEYYIWNLQCLLKWYIVFGCQITGESSLMKSERVFQSIPSIRQFRQKGIWKRGR